MQSVETEGDNIDAAIEMALQQLGVPRDSVEIEILAGGGRGLLGFGARKARIRATLRALLHDDGDTPPAAYERKPATRAQVEPTQAEQQTAERARDLLQKIVGLLGVDAQVGVQHLDEHIVLDLSGDDSGVLIGRRGQMLDALEYVLNRIVLRDQSDAARLVIDSQDYRARRREALEEMAQRMAQQAKTRRRPVTLNPMSPRDRRVVHMVLQDDPAVTTKSSGEGYYRRLVIIPKGGGGRSARPSRDN